jgi:hypothetical protein
MRMTLRSNASRMIHHPVIDKWLVKLTLLLPLLPNKTNKANAKQCKTGGGGGTEHNDQQMGHPVRMVMCGTTNTSNHADGGTRAHAFEIPKVRVGQFSEKARATKQPNQQRRRFINYWLVKEME